MATESPSVQTAVGGAGGEPISGPRGGHRGRGRGRGQNRGRGNGATNDSYNGGAGRQGGRGPRPNEGHTMNTGDLAARFSSQQKTAAPPGLPIGNAGKTVAEGADESEAEVCFICASPIIHEAIMPCNHRTCHICCLRMRALYKDKNCMHCRAPAETVIFTDNATKRFEDFTDADIASSDNNLGIRYENDSIRDDTLILLRYNCPDGDCDVACLGWPDLHRHVKSVHHMKICDLCSRHKKVFTHEHELYKDADLSRHMRKGDDNPGAVDQSGFKGHPLCQFCGSRFYGDDELYVHCRQAHERCNVCERLNIGAPQYYANYNTLSEHYRKDHFVCLEKDCLDNKHIVFGSEMDLKAHQLEVHGNTLSKDVRRDARTVDINSFDYRTPYVPERRGGMNQREQRDGRGRGRGRDPNAEAIPASTAQPLRRDEQAFQRQMAIHSAQSVITRNFGGQLTAPTPAQARAPAAQVPAAMSVPRPSRNAEAVADAVESLELTPQEQARRLRHQDVIERASTLLQNDSIKLNQFRNTISSYKNNALSATALIDSFFALFADTTASALGTLIREVGDLFEDKTKTDAIRTAWNDWRAINEDYPSLPAAIGNNSSSIPLNWAVTSSNSSSTGSAVKSSRVLRLKSSTAQSSRSSQTRSWGSASPAASPPVSSSMISNPFPGLPPASSRPQNTQSTKVSTVPWVPSASSSSNTPRPTPPTSRPASRATGPRGGSDMFPALPPAAKPQSTIFGYGNGMVRRDGARGASSSNPWGPQSEAEAGKDAEAEEEGAGKGKRKGNKGKKVLVAWG